MSEEDMGTSRCQDPCRQDSGSQTCFMHSARHQAENRQKKLDDLIFQMLFRYSANQDSKSNLHKIEACRSLSPLRLPLTSQQLSTGCVGSSQAYTTNTSNHKSLKLADHVSNLRLRRPRSSFGLSCGHHMGFPLEKRVMRHMVDICC